MDAKLQALRRQLANGDASARGPLQRGLLRVGHSLEEAWVGLPLEDLLDWDECEQRLTPEGVSRLREDVSNLDAARLVQNAPRDEKGRWVLGSRMLLGRYESGEKLSRGRDLWLVAAAPDRRRDDQVLSVLIMCLIARNHAHVWEHAPSLWDARTLPSEEGIWGVAGIPWKQVNAKGTGAREQAVSRLVKKCEQGKAAAGERAALCMLLQEEGRVLEALQLYDVEVHPEVLDPGQAIVERIRAMHGGHGPASYDDDTDRGCIDRALTECAPWRFAPALDLEAARVSKLKTSRPVRRRLLALPHQVQQSKMSLFLVRDKKSGRTRLELESTADNDRLEEVLWKRPPPCARPPLLHLNEEPVPKGARCRPLESHESEEEGGADRWESVRGTPWSPS